MIFSGFSYLKWHYTRALLDMGRIFGNIIWFLYHFFSIPILLHTFFSPWRRMGESYQGGMLDIGDKLATFVINTLMRLVGVVCRSAVILAGIAAILFTVLCEVASFIIWLAAPALLLVLLISGFHLLFI